MTQMKQEVLCLVVDNNYGVLTRISSLFGRKGYNIDTLTVSTTDSPRISRITLTVSGESHEISQIMAQCEKLEEVRSVDLLSVDNAVLREIVLVKVKATQEKLGYIMEICNIYKASVVSLTTDTLIVELTGKPKKVDAFIDLIKTHGIVELSRSGATAMARVSE